LQFKEESKKQYSRIWSQFRDFVPEHDFELAPPAEDSFTLFFNFLRQEKKFASTTLWTYYSCLNSIMKRKYNVKLQDLPRLTMLIKGFNTDIKTKAPIFDETQLKAFLLGNMDSSYWLVRQAISIVAFFGGLRLQECQGLVLEKMVRTSEGYKITHSRVKQRSDQRDSVFLVPANGGFADRLGIYLGKVNSNLNKFTGRVWWTGTKGQTLRGLPMGKNMIGKVPHDVATRLYLSKPEDYTFHSYRRTSATSAANGGMTSEQMQGFFGWKHASMCQEYISTSNPAIRHMARTLGSFDLGLPEVEEEERAEEVLVMVEEEQNDNKGLLPEELEDLSSFVMEEDPDLYAAAGISFPATSSPTNNKVNIQQTIQSAISSVPALQGANVTVKVLVMENNNGTIHF
jgi:site-specific recombinase XerC